MQDVAEKAGVSKSTVSQYLNGRFEYMSAETKKRIQTAIEALGYRPNQVAKSLKQKRTSTIGLIVANILHRFSTLVCRAVEDTCHEQDYHAIICNADDNPEKERKYIDMLRAKQVDGILVIPSPCVTPMRNPSSCKIFFLPNFLMISSPSQFPATPSTGPYFFNIR